MTTRTGVAIVDAAIIAAVTLQGISFGLDPTTTSAINSLALLGISVITAWTAYKTAAIKKVADATHTLSNSAMGAQLLANVQNLEVSSVLAHRLAVGTNSAGDLAAAVAIDVRVESARAEYQEHVKKQAIVDSK